MKCYVTNVYQNRLAKNAVCFDVKFNNNGKQKKCDQLIREMKNILLWTWPGVDWDIGKQNHGLKLFHQIIINNAPMFHLNAHQISDHSV